MVYPRVVLPCCRRIIVQAYRQSYGVKPVLRVLHTSLASSETQKLHLKEETREDQNVDASAERHAEEVVFEDQDSEVIRKRYQVDQVGETVKKEHWREIKWTWKQLPGLCLQLSKPKLTCLVVLTALGGYAMAPAPFDFSKFLLTAFGTSLCSAAANTFNQWLEVPFDSQMARTRNRVLVRGKLEAFDAALFGVTSGVCGTLVLYHAINPLTAALGFANILLYAAVYTPLKRISIANTWVGSVVGAIPPMMGWAACMGSLSPAALVLPGILYAWQFAHFNALSWGLRGDYSRAGYRMMAVTDPALCKRVALRYSVATIPICTLAPYCDLTTWFFAGFSLPVNGYLVYLAWRFYRDSDYASSRRLFKYSLVHLPLLMLLVLVEKKRWYFKEHTDT